MLFCQHGNFETFSDGTFQLYYIMGCLNSENQTFVGLELIYILPNHIITTNVLHTTVIQSYILQNTGL